MKVGDKYVARSLIDSVFECEIESEASVGGRPAIRPLITGTAWICGWSSQCERLRHMAR
jgi:proline racemase